MSNYSTTLDMHGAVDTAARPTTKGFWQRFYAAVVASRQAQAERQLATYFNSLSEQQRKDLGYPTAADRR